MPIQSTLLFDRLLKYNCKTAPCAEIRPGERFYMRQKCASILHHRRSKTAARSASKMIHQFEKLSLVQHNFLFFRSISSKIMAEFTKESGTFLADSEKTHETARMAQKLL